MSTFSPESDIPESATTIRQQEVSSSSSEAIVESHAGPLKRRRVASIKVRETLEIQAEIESARANKVSSAPRERTNRLSGNEGYTRPKNVATLPSSSASSSSLSSDGGTFDSPNDADIQPVLEVANQIIAAPSNLDGYNRHRTEREALARVCNFGSPGSIKTCFPTREGKGQFSCPPILLYAAETYDGKAAIIRDWRGLSSDQQRVKYSKAYEETAAAQQRASNVAKESQQHQQQPNGSKKRKREVTLADAREIHGDFGDVTLDDPTDPFYKVLASQEKDDMRVAKKKRKKAEEVVVRFTSIFCFILCLPNVLNAHNYLFYLSLYLVYSTILSLLLPHPQQQLR